MENPVRRTTLLVLNQTKYVRLNRKRIKETAVGWARRKITVATWPTELHLRTSDGEKLLTYIILLDSLNFCFWSKGERWQVEYNGEKYRGYWALALALKKFFETEPQKARLEYFREISFREFKNILEGGRNLFFLKKRWEIVRAVSRVVLRRYGTALKFVASAKGSAGGLVQKIYRELPSFDDTALFQGRKIYFLKRAQILISDIWGAFRGEGIGAFRNMEYLTAFPDYKLPQILHHLGIFEYSDAFAKAIAARAMIPRGSRWEVEIRSATVWAVEFLTAELRRRGVKLYPLEVDWFLWNESQKIKMREPHHRTRTIYY